MNDILRFQLLAIAGGYFGLLATIVLAPRLSERLSRRWVFIFLALELAAFAGSFFFYAKAINGY